MDNDRPHAQVVLAEGGYDCDNIQNAIKIRGATPVILGNSNRKTPILFDTITYALRNRIKCCFNKLNCFRRFARRYDKTGASYLVFTHIIAVRLWFKSLLCHLKFGPFGVGVFCRSYPWLDEDVWHESIEVHGRPESFRREAGRGRNASRGDLSQGRDQLGNIP